MADVLIKKRQLEPLEISNSDVASDADIATSKLADGGKFIKSDGTVQFEEDQSMGLNKLTDLAAPTDANDAVRLTDLQNAASGIDIHDPVETASDSNITLSGLQTIAGYTTAAGDRVLVKSQTDATENGVYTAASGTWSRATDMDEAGELKNGSKVLVQKGDHAGSTYICTGENPIVIGTSDIPWVQDSQSVLYSAGAGLNLSGTTFSVGTASSNRIKVNASNIDLATSGVTAGTYTKIQVDAYGRAIDGSNPTTLSGNGILDAYTQTQIGNFFSGTSSMTGYNKTDWDNAADKQITGITFNTGSGLLTLSTKDASNLTENLDGRYSLLGHTHALTDLTDTDIASPANQQLLRYDGTDWVNWTPNFITGNQAITLTGDVAGSGTTSITTTLKTVNSNTGTFGDGTHVSAITVNAKGLITAASETPISFPVTSVNSKTGAVSLGLSDLSDTTITSSSTGNLLRYNGTKWTNWVPTYISGNQSISFSASGDVTGTATGTTTLSPTLTIGAKKVTYSKIQDVTKSSILGRYASTDGTIQEITLGSGLSLSASTGVLSATGTGGTVTSVGLSAPTGFSVSGSPVTSSGTLGLSFATGYSLPTTSKQTSWDNKQDALSGTGFVKVSGSTITYDNSTYLTAEADTLQSVTNRGNSTSKTITISANSCNTLLGGASGLVLDLGTVGGGWARSFYIQSDNSEGDNSLGTAIGAYGVPGDINYSFWSIDNNDISTPQTKSTAIRLYPDGSLYYGTPPANASAATNFLGLSSDGHTISTRTAAQVLSDIGADRKLSIDADVVASVANYNGDYNDLKTSFIHGAATSDNKPDWNSTSGGSLLTSFFDSNQGFATQLGIDYFSDDVFIRRMYNGTWYPYFKLASQDWVNSQDFLTSYTETDPVWTAARNAATTIPGSWYFSANDISFNSYIHFSKDATWPMGLIFDGGVAGSNYQNFIGNHNSSVLGMAANATPMSSSASPSWQKGKSDQPSAFLSLSSLDGLLRIYTSPASTPSGTFSDFWGTPKIVATTDQIPADYLSTSPGSTGGTLDSLSDAFSTTRSGAFFASSGSANNPTNISYNILNLYRSSTAWSQLAFMASGGTLEEPWYNNRPNSQSWVQLASRNWVEDQNYTTVDARDKWVANEILSGTVNGTNKIFTLANTPVAGSQIIYLNGNALTPGAGNGYTISGSTVTMTIAPKGSTSNAPADSIMASYFKQ